MEKFLLLMFGIVMLVFFAGWLCLARVSWQLEKRKKELLRQMREEG